MTGAAHSLYAEIDELAAAVDSLSPHGKAVIFGVCGRALAPLLRQVEQRSEGRFTVPDLDVALDLIQAFATGSAEAADYSELRARLDRAVSEDEHPWSTYAQDVLICVDAGLALASAADRPRGILIHFALEPLTAVLEDRGTEIFRTFGRRYWSREIINDPAMAAALGFLHELIAKASNVASVDSYGFRALVSEAAVLRPEPSATTAREAQRLQRRFAQGVSSTRPQTEGHEQHERGRCPPRHRGQGTRPRQGQDRHHRVHRGQRGRGRRVRAGPAGVHARRRRLHLHRLQLDRLHFVRLCILRFHQLRLRELGLHILGLQLHGFQLILRFELHRIEFQLEQLRRLQLRLVALVELGRQQPGHLGRLVMTDTAMGTEPAAPAVPAGASWRALGTFVHLLVTEPARLEQARQLLTADLAEVDAACSRFRPDSELCSLSSSGRPTEISPLLAEAIAVALRAARLTDGDVDPTVGAAMLAVGYDRDFAHVKPEGPGVKLTAREVPGWRQVRLESRTLIMPPGVRLDLGATAKAWAADRSAARIAARAGGGVLVSLGGDIAVAGPAPAAGWQVRVQDVTGAPEDTPEGSYARIAIRDGGLATSSTAARRWRRGGDVLHHILDPQTGLPAEPVWRTVSVAAGSCADANAASTAAVIRGRRAPGWLTHLGLPARLVDATGVVFTVVGWPAEADRTDSENKGA